ncbi:hypothetical protein FBU30_002981 [Linnemannia zychae]|nr:hypothetical protein FBU30_002981 [Linnemannia zychae]
MITIPPITSAIVATSYTILVAVLACVQFSRSRTPLRLGSAVMAVCGLSISALSIVYAADKMSLSIFWVYQFIAECIAVTWIISTIIQLGYAFYPLTRHQTLIWRTALASVIIYDLIAISELTYYCYAVWGSHILDKESTPVVWIYWVRQMVKVLACGVTIAYLFVPLVRHHNSAGVAMIADSNTLAVGTWYLSALGATSVGYCAMFVYYMTRPEEVFSPQAQSLDLCIRLIACPIFSMPPPRILLRHYQEKYGSGARDDNLNTMIEDGITNDPRPRRPAMLVAQSSFPSARNADIFFDDDHRQYRQHRPYFATKQSVDFHSNYTTHEMEENQLKHQIEEGHVVGRNATPSSNTTATDNNNSTCPGGSSGEGDKEGLTTPSSTSLASLPVTKSAVPTTEHKSYPVVGIDETLPSNLTIPTRSIEFQTTPNIKRNINLNKHDEEDETAVAARRISRRLTMEGRHDGLDILNITGRIKWPHWPNVANSHSGIGTSSPTTSTISIPSSPLGIKSSQSFPTMALNRAGPGGSIPEMDLSHAIFTANDVLGGSKRQRLSAISSVLEVDGILDDNQRKNNDSSDDEESIHSKRQVHMLYEKQLGSITTHNNNSTGNDSNNSTIRPASPSVDTNNTTPTSSRISNELTTLNNIRKQSCDTLSRLYGDGPTAAKMTTITGPHSTTLLQTNGYVVTKCNGNGLPSSSSLSFSEETAISQTSISSATP